MLKPLKKYFGLWLLALLVFSCSQSITRQEYIAYAQSPESGLSQSNSWEGADFEVSVWPFSLQKEETLQYFQIKSEYEGLTYTLTEENFKLKVDETEYPCSIVIAENRGSNSSSVLMVGFPKTFFNDDFTLLLFKGTFSKVSFPFDYKDFKKLKRLKIKS